jgi:hypothetical protein
MMPSPAGCGECNADAKAKKLFGSEPVRMSCQFCGRFKRSSWLVLGGAVK